MKFTNCSFLLALSFISLGTFCNGAAVNIPRSKARGLDTEPSLFRRDLDNPATAFSAMVNALEVMQDVFWSPSSSTWPTGIDWTRATINTHLTTTLSMMTSYQYSTYRSEIQQYFNEVNAFFSGENVTSLVTQKYDDQQWVILEWLEAIKFINLYSSIDKIGNAQSLIGNYAHRARMFWDLASKGYDTTLCGGGMLWTDQLAPYKNAITNQLFVASSVGMYLYFPGDGDIKARDSRYLNAAIKEYNWLSTSNMTNSQGLYVDGFHITGWTSNTSIGTGKCDAIDESVYTYNQGVLLSGLRGLWDATGTQKYLNDGYTLLSNVMRATGWQSAPSGVWSGLGSDGILQDHCDVDGSCSQDGQNFKGIFFHHLTLFCQPLAQDESEQKSPNTGAIFQATQAEANAHQAQCQTYAPWILHNAQYAFATKNSTGVYGGWWDVNSSIPSGWTASVPAAADVLNKGIPFNSFWRLLSNPVVPVAGTTPAAVNSSAADPNNRGRGRTVETQSGGLALMTSLVNVKES